MVERSSGQEEGLEPLRGIGVLPVVLFCREFFTRTLAAVPVVAPSRRLAIGPHRLRVTVDGNQTETEPIGFGFNFQALTIQLHGDSVRIRP